MNEQRIEKIKTLIGATTILTPQEKSEWSALLPLMNDKQFSELEDILLPHSETPVITTPPAAPLTPPAAPRPAPVAPQAPKPVMPVIPPGNPPLKHIQNLPSQFSTPKPVVPRPAPIPQRPAPAAQRPSPIATKPAPVAPRPAPTPPPQRVPQPPQTKPATFTSLESLSAVSVPSIQNIDHAAVLVGLRKLAEQFGYFTVLQAFEASPLYKEYLHYGKLKLSQGAVETKLPMLPAEFEFITDILLSLKVNRV